MSLVIDSSAALAWIYPDEAPPGLHAIFDRIADDGATVPSLWWLEIANSLTIAACRGRIDPRFRAAALADFGLLAITTDPHTRTNAWTSSLRLADRFRLTVYDATYLELAERRALPLASLDENLRAAAASLGVEVLPAP